jgi:outer membrane protein OmpA-like peptidoglycan-associated protein
VDDGFAVSRPNDRGHLEYGARLDLGYALNPLVVERRLGDAGSEIQPIVEHQLVGHLSLSIGLFDRVVVFAGLPVNLLNDGPGFSTVPGGDGAGIGDVFVGARARLVGERDDLGALSLQLTAWFPTAAAARAEQRYTGEDGVVLHPVLLMELRPVSFLRITGNVGARFRAGGSVEVVNLSLSHELTYAVGITVQPVEVLSIYGELFGAQTFANIGGQGARESAPIEGLLGVRVNPIPELSVGLAGGAGFARGYGAPDFRGVFTVGWASQPAEPAVDTDGDGLPDDVDRCPTEPEDRDSFEDDDGCPDPDNDRDGILDTSDECPNEPETVNGMRDEDGCPDVGDRDGDGLLDDVDRCPDEAEDRDSFEDEDGCPDPDNDRDGVLDGADRCPLEAGTPENGGCPDRDRDSDTVVDRVDNCPDVPGRVENRGCPEAQRVVITESRLEILDLVHFRTNSDAIERRSHALLRNVAAVLNSHPEIAQVIVEGHTDSRAPRDYNMSLSQRRAEAVVRFLVSAGVAANRLVARGFGPDRPVVPNATTPEQHAQNRRVEFNIPRTEGVEQRNSAATTTIDR